MNKGYRRMPSAKLSVEEATDIIPLLEDEVHHLTRKLKEEPFADEEGEQIAHRLFRLDRLCSRLSRILSEKREAEVGREPEFIQAVRDAIEGDTL